MLDDYKINGPKSKIDVEIEAEVAKKLDKMTQHTKLSASEIINTALKRFIAGHSDFLPSSEVTRQKKLK